MIEALGKWIITICIAIFFTTAVQMILPDSSIKKYCNFVLGLIVFVVMITPIIEFFNSGVTVEQLIDNSSSLVFGEEEEGEYQKYRDESINTTLETFKHNLEESCADDLKSQFGGKGYLLDFSVSYDSDNSVFIIDKVDVGFDDGSIVNVKKIQIGEPDSVSVGSTDDDLGKEGAEIKHYISTKYNIDESKIYVYKSDKNN